LWQDVSSYGTYLNGRQLAKKERAVLRPGDSVTFCSPGVALNGLTTGLPSLRLAPDASRARPRRQDAARAVEARASNCSQQPDL